MPNSLNFVRGSDALRKHVKLSDLKCPAAVTSTKLRKHIATLSQLLNLQERELEMLATFLGHDLSVHREFYRLPESTTQIAKVGKMLMMMEQGKFGDFAGKKLDEIDLDLNGEIICQIALKEDFAHISINPVSTKNFIQQTSSAKILSFRLFFCQNFFWIQFVLLVPEKNFYQVSLKCAIVT